MSFNNDLSAKGYGGVVKRFTDSIKGQFYEAMFLRDGYTVDGPPVVYAQSKWYKDDIKSFGYTPIELMLGFYITNKSRCVEHMKWQATLGSFHFDHSNCGVAHFHHINNGGCRGVGSRILRLVEDISSMARRKFITCTVSAAQDANYHAYSWLEKHGYHMASEFRGGNSGQNCRLYVKDLQIHPFTEPNYGYGEKAA